MLQIQCTTIGSAIFGHYIYKVRGVSVTYIYHSLTKCTIEHRGLRGSGILVYNGNFCHS